MSGARVFDQRVSRAGLALLRPSGAAPHPVSPTRSRFAGGPSEALRAVTQSAGKPLDPAARAGFEARFGHDFGRIRIHASGEAESAADRLNARAFTLGEDIAFGRGQFAPHSAEGDALIAHELTHAIQQKGKPGPTMQSVVVGEAFGPLEAEAAQSAAAIRNARNPVVSAGVAPAEIQCQPKPEAAPAPDPLKTQQAGQIMADPAYIDNNLASIQFFGAQLAILHYADGKQFRLGLVPQYVQAPVEGVDYRTPRDVHIPLASPQPGAVRFLPRGKDTISHLPDTSPLSVDDLFKAFGRTITFNRDAASGRIVPTEVNSITAPRLCQVLRETEAEYVREFDAFAQGGKKVAEKAKTVVEIAGFVPVGAGATEKAAERAAARAAAAAGEGAESSIAKKLFDLIGKKAGAQEIAAEGVSFGNVEVAQVGSVLSVRFSAIVNISRLPNQGKVMMAVWEGAAVQAAKKADAKSVQIAVTVVQKPALRAHLESQGYFFEMLKTLYRAGEFEGALVKEIAL